MVIELQDDLLDVKAENVLDDVLGSSVWTSLIGEATL